MNAALYSRVSTAEQAEHGYSIDEQIDRMKAYCTAMSWTIAKVYTDAGYSGATLDRPGLQTLMEDIKTGSVDVVVVYKLDRLSRSQKDALFLIEDLFLKNNVNFVSISENFDTGTALGRAMIGILAVFAQLEREQIRERMSLGKAARVKSGKWHGASWTPVGYDYVAGSNELTVNEYEAEYVKKIFRWYAQGYPLRSIARELEGVRHKYGDYDEQALRHILRNSTYIGKVRHKGVEYQGTHEPLINEMTFRKVNDILDGHHDIWKSNVRSGQHPSLLTGIIFCARCGARYHTVKWTPDSPVQYSCYSRDKKISKMIKDRSCKNRYWKVPELNQIVLDEIKKLSVDTDALQELISQDDSKEQVNLPVLKKQLSKLKRERSKYMDLYAIGNMDLDAVKQKLEPLNSRIANLEKELQTASSAVQEQAESFAVFDNALSIIEQGTPEEQRELVLSLIKKIELDGDDVTIHWKFS